MVNVLRTRSGRHGVTGARGATGGDIVASLATMKAIAFSDIFGTSCGVGFDRLTLSMSMALGSLWGQEKEVED